MTNESKARELFNSEIGNLDVPDFDRGFEIRTALVEMAEWKDQQFKEELGLIIEWFDHIAQIADDRKTANGFVMQYSNALDEIKCIARHCSEYVSML